MKTDLKNNDIFLYILPLLAFICLAIPYLGAMGLSIDEGVISLGVSDFLKQFTSEAPSHSKYNYWNCIIINNLRFPVNFSEYNGCINLYLSALSCKLATFNAFWFRFPNIVIGGISLMFIYKTANFWLNRKIAFLTTLLLAINPVFINSCKIGHYTEEINAICFFWVGFYYFSLFTKNNKNIYLALTALCFGIGVSAKLIFGAYLIPFTLLFIWFSKSENKSFFSKTQILLGVSCFSLGIFPFIADNISRNFEPIHNFYNIMTSGGLNQSLDAIPILKTRFLHFIYLLQQDVLPCFSGTFAYQKFYNIDIILFLITPLLIFSSKNIYRKKMIYVSIFYLITFLLTVFTPKKPFSSHMVILMPLVQLFFAVAVLEACNRYKNLKKIIILLLAILLVRDVIVNTALLKDIRKNNVNADFSAVIYDICEYLTQNDIKEVYAVSYLPNSQTVSTLVNKDISIHNYTDYIATNSYIPLAVWIDEKIMPLKSFFLIIQNNKQESEVIKTKLHTANYTLTLQKSFKAGDDLAELILVTKK